MFRSRPGLLLLLLPLLAGAGESGPAGLAEGFMAALNTDDHYALVALLDDAALGRRIDALGLGAGIVAGSRLQHRRQSRVMVQLLCVNLNRDCQLATCRAGTALPVDGSPDRVVMGLAATDADQGGSRRWLALCERGPGGWRIVDLANPDSPLWFSYRFALVALEDWEGELAPWLRAVVPLPELADQATDRQLAAQVRQRIAAMDLAAMPAVLRAAVLGIDFQAAATLGDDAAIDGVLAALGSLEPHHPGSARIVAQAARRRGDAATAVSAGRTWLELAGGDADTMAAVVWGLEQLGRQEELRELLGRLLDADPGDDEALGRLLEQAGDDLTEPLRRLRAAPDPAQAFNRFSWRQEKRAEVVARLARAWAQADAAALPPRLWLARRQADDGAADAAIAALLALPAPPAGATGARTQEAPDQAALELAFTHGCLRRFAEHLADPPRLARLLAASWQLGRQHRAELRVLIPALRDAPACDRSLVAVLEARLARMSGDEAAAATAWLKAWPGLAEELRSQHREEMLAAVVGAGRAAEVRALLAPADLFRLLRCLAAGGRAEAILELTANLDAGDAGAATAWAWRGAAFLAQGDRAQARALALRALRLGRKDGDGNGDQPAGDPVARNLLALLAHTAPDLGAFAAECPMAKDLLPLLGPVAELRREWKALTAWFGGRRLLPADDPELHRLRARAFEAEGKFPAADAALVKLAQQLKDEEWRRRQARVWRVELWDRAGRGADLFGAQEPEPDDVLTALRLRRAAGDAPGIAAILARQGQRLPADERARQEALLLHEQGEWARARKALEACLDAAGAKGGAWQLQQAYRETLRRLGEPQACYDHLAGSSWVDLPALAEGGDEATVEILIARHQKAFPDDFQPALLRARRAYAAGRWDEARGLVAPLLKPIHRANWQARQLDAWCRLRQGAPLDFADWERIQDGDEPGRHGQPRPADLLAAAVRPANAGEERMVARLRLRAALAAGDGAKAWSVAEPLLDALAWGDTPLAGSELVELHLARGQADLAWRTAVLACLGGDDGDDEDEPSEPNAWVFARLAAAAGDGPVLAGWLERLDAWGGDRKAIWADRWLAAALRGPCRELAARWPEPKDDKPGP